MTQLVIICVLCLLVLILAGALHFIYGRLQLLHTNYEAVLENRNDRIDELVGAVEAKTLTIETLKAEINEKGSSISQAKDMIGQLKIPKNIKLEIMRRL